MTEETTSTPQPLASSVAIMQSEQMRMRHFLNLQQSQAEFLAWLESSEKKVSIDSYIYRKIR